jgi:pilus assembly protein CpaE
VVIGPVTDPHILLDFVRAGADDYLDQAGELHSELHHLVHRLTSRAQDAPRGKLLTITSASGGTGCSVIAANLGVAVAKQAGACGLLDLDFGGGTLSAMLNLKRRHTLVDLCRHLDKMDRAMVEQSFVRHETGVHLLTGPSHFADAACITSRALDTIVQFARSLFPFVIVDGLDAFRLTALEEAVASDTVFVVTRLEFASLVNTCRGVEHLAAHGIGGQALNIVINRYGEAGHVSHRDAAGALGRPIAHFVPDAAKLINASINVGRPVILEAPRATVSRALSALAESQFQASSRATAVAMEA